MMLQLQESCYLMKQTINNITVIHVNGVVPLQTDLIFYLRNLDLQN